MKLIRLVSHPCLTNAFVIIIVDDVAIIVVVIVVLVVVLLLQVHGLLTEGISIGVFK